MPRERLARRDRPSAPSRRDGACRAVDPRDVARRSRDADQATPLRRGCAGPCVPRNGFSRPFKNRFRLPILLAGSARRILRGQTKPWWRVLAPAGQEPGSAGRSRTGFGVARARRDPPVVRPEPPNGGRAAGRACRRCGRPACRLSSCSPLVAVQVVAADCAADGPVSEQSRREASGRVLAHRGCQQKLVVLSACAVDDGRPAVPIRAMLVTCSSSASRDALQRQPSTHWTWRLPVSGSTGGWGGLRCAGQSTGGSLPGARGVPKCAGGPRASWGSTS